MRAAGNRGASSPLTCPGVGHPRSSPTILIVGGGPALAVIANDTTPHAKDMERALRMAHAFPRNAAPSQGAYQATSDGLAVRAHPKNYDDEVRFHVEVDLPARNGRRVVAPKGVVG